MLPPRSLPIMHVGAHDGAVHPWGQRSLMQIHNDMERRRVRRTLAEVKNKLEEALRLSEQIQNKGKHAEPTTTDRRR
jgi:hypothetical protein